MSDEWGILPIPTSPQMMINIPIFHVKMKYFDLFSTLLTRKNLDNTAFSQHQKYRYVLKNLVYTQI